jgi:recombination protein RecA
MAKDDIQILKNLINKEMKDPELIRIGDTKSDIEVIDTGSIALNNALGVGGYPKGRIIEIYGPEASGKTTVTLAAIAKAQKNNITCAFIDAEHALSPTLAKGVGVNWDNLLFAQPKCGEQALDVVIKLVESAKVGLIVIDSVAALTPKEELEGTMEDTQMGAQARMLGKALRKLSGIIDDTKCVVIFINQLRDKLGVMFGCLHADTLINFTDGKSIKIKEIVDKKIKGNVWSYDEKNKKFTQSKITDWHYNGNVNNSSDFLSICTRCAENKNGFVNVTVTPNHKIFTDHGWIEARNLNIGDKLLTKQESILNGSCGEFLRGVLVGDSHTSHVINRLSSSLKLRDNINVEYMEWKVNKLNDVMKFTKIKCKKGIYYLSKFFSELTDIKNRYPNRDPMLLLNDFNWIGFAIWIMDDATYFRNRYTLSIKRLKGNYEKIDEISNKLDSIGLYHHSSYGGKIIFDKNISDLIASNISKYVPKCMRYKLPESEVSEYKQFSLKRELTHSNAFAEVIGIRKASNKQMRELGKYDLSIENNHNYLAGGLHNGVLVHNSPETTPGGKALKFFSSVRLDVRRKEAIKNGDVTIGNQLKVKVIKNKVAMPHTIAEFDLMFGKGIDNTKDVINLGVSIKVIEKKSSFYTYKNAKGNGIDNFIVSLIENNLKDELEKEVQAMIIKSPIITIEPPNEKEEFDEEK